MCPLNHFKAQSVQNPMIREDPRVTGFHNVNDFDRLLTYYWMPVSDLNIYDKSSVS